MHVGIPGFSFRDVSGIELPVLARLVQPCQEALLLLVTGQVQPELENYRAVPGEVFLLIASGLQAVVPDRLQVDLAR